MNPVMNDTKWEELRLAMYSLGPQAPKWRNRILVSGYVSPWDGDWYYRFREGGYTDIEWVEIQIISLDQRAAVLALIQSIHLPGCETEHGFKIIGYAAPPHLSPCGASLEYI